MKKKREEARQEMRTQKKKREKQDVSGRQSSRVTKVPVSRVAQGVQVHGVAGVRHEEEKEEGEVEQEVEGEKEENNTQGRRHMCMDGMK